MVKYPVGNSSVHFYGMLKLMLRKDLIKFMYSNDDGNHEKFSVCHDDKPFIEC